MNLTPDGSPVLLRNTGFKEIYALDLCELAWYQGANKTTT